MALAILFVLPGCVQPTAYGPLGDNGGYAEFRIEEDRYRIRFLGNSLTSRTVVEHALLLRAAEVALAQGHAGFRIVERIVEPVTRYVDLDHGWGSAPVWSDRDRSYRHNPAIGAQLTPITSYDASAEIRLIDPPFVDDRSYDAQQVIANLRPLIDFQRP